jgi:hypothetical protein
MHQPNLVEQLSSKPALRKVESRQEPEKQAQLNELQARLQQRAQTIKGQTTPVVKNPVQEPPSSTNPIIPILRKTSDGDTRPVTPVRKLSDETAYTDKPKRPAPPTRSRQVSFDEENTISKSDELPTPMEAPAEDRPIPPLEKGKQLGEPKNTLTY